MLLGIMMLVFGLNGFLQFMPNPEMGQEMQTFLGAVEATGYMFPLISLVETIAGALLLANILTPVALIILFPVLFNAFLAHLVLDPASIGAAAFALLMNGILFIVYKEKYLAFMRKDRVSN